MSEPSRMEDVSFASGGETCAAWHFPGSGEELTGEGGRPCVVMAHGFGATRDSGLQPFAERFAAAGLDVVLFDYRHFGTSTGEPRQLISVARQHADYHAAIAFARELDGVDPERIVVWGTSYAGGHAIVIAAEDQRLAAAISQIPAADGLAALLNVARYEGPLHLLRATLDGIRDGVRGVAGREPLRIPIVGPPGTIAAMSSEDAEPGMRAISGPSWRNEFCARELLEVGLNRPVRNARDVRCPLLIQIADRDSVAPVKSAQRAAWQAPGWAEVRHYPIGHFDIYLGEWFERSIADQLHFLRRHLQPATGSRVERPTAS